MVDFKEQLRRQLNFLERSCRDFDAGHVEEAVRIATSLRVLFHHTNNSISLLSRFGPKLGLNLLSTADIPPKQELITTALVRLSIQMPELRCLAVPLLDRSDRNEMVPFETWWRKERIVELDNGAGAMHRRELILGAANKDGGAHVDHELDPIYDLTRRGVGVTVEFVFKNKKTHEIPWENVHYASLRQIAYEVLNSHSILGLK